jgi:hypothetical protein
MRDRLLVPLVSGLLLAACGAPPAAIDQISQAATVFDVVQATAAVQDVCHGSYRNHGLCMKCVTAALNDLKWNKRIDYPTQGEVTSIFARGWCDGAACIPTTCAIAGAACGSVSDDCGGELECGTCAAPLTCGGGGVANACGFNPILDRINGR